MFTEYRDTLAHLRQQLARPAVVLHGGLTRGPDGRMWLKNGIVLDIGTRRMDDEAPGEDAATAGRWIQFVELWPRDDYPSIDRYVFAPWKG